MDYKDAVRKLIAQAESVGVTEPEKDAFIAKASEVMMKHKIDKDMVQRKEGISSTILTRKFNFRNPHGHQREYLFQKILTALGCDCVRAKKEQVLYVFGTQDDIERGDWLYSILIPYILSMASTMRSLNYTAAQRNSYIIGYADAVGGRLNKSKVKISTADPSGVAVMLAETKTRVRAARDNQFPYLKTKKITFSGSEYDLGHTMGSEVNLHNIETIPKIGKVEIEKG